jgi:hypothetical protein
MGRCSWGLLLPFSTSPSCAPSLLANGARATFKCDADREAVRVVRVGVREGPTSLSPNRRRRRRCLRLGATGSSRRPHLAHRHSTTSPAYHSPLLPLSLPLSLACSNCPPLAACRSPDRFRPRSRSSGSTSASHRPRAPASGPSAAAAASARASALSLSLVARHACPLSLTENSHLLALPDGRVTDPASGFIQNAYPKLKAANPDLKVLIREARQIQPKVYARFGPSLPLLLSPSPLFRHGG